MNIATLFSLISIWLGLCGSFFFATGILKLKPEIIARLSQAYVGLHFDQVNNLASLKADFICGTVFIVIASLCQITNLKVNLNSLEKYPLYWIGIGFLALVHLLPLLFLLLRDKLATIFKKQAVLSYCRDEVVYYMHRYIKEKKTTKAVWSEEGSLVFDAKEYCGLKTPDDVTFDKFFKEYVEHVKAKVPDEFDWNALPKTPVSQIK